MAIPLKFFTLILCYGIALYGAWNITYQSEGLDSKNLCLYLGGAIAAQLIDRLAINPPKVIWVVVLSGAILFSLAGFHLFESREQRLRYLPEAYVLVWFTLCIGGYHLILLFRTWRIKSSSTLD